MDILWLILLVLFWIFKNSGKKKARNSGPQGQPWDQARRRQSVPRPMEPPKDEFPFPLPPTVREIFEEFEEIGSWTEGERGAKEKTVVEGKPGMEGVSGIEGEPGMEGAGEPVPDLPVYGLEVQTVPEPAAIEEIPPAACPTPRQQSRPSVGVNLSPSALLNGIIMSEILQPPRAIRSLRGNRRQSYK